MPYERKEKVSGIEIPGGAFVLSRKIFSSSIWIKPSLYLKIWIWIIGRPNHDDQGKGGYLYKRGEFTTTYDEIIKAGAHYHNREHIIPSLKQIRTILAWFVSEKMIFIEPIRAGGLTLPANQGRAGQRRTWADPRAYTRAYVGIRIVVINYDPYQSLENYKGRHKGRPTSQLGHNNNNGIIKNKEYVEDSDELRLASFLLEEILKNKPDFKKPKLQPWAKDIDLMIRKDKRLPDRIREVIHWAQGDSFWRKNILSTGSLRDKFDRLELSMQEKLIQDSGRITQYEDLTGRGIE
jgi:hypothetical protein